MDKISSIKHVASIKVQGPKNPNFKELLDKKRTSSPVITNQDVPRVSGTNSMDVKNIIRTVVNDHEMATKTVRTFMTRSDYSPEKLISIQYRTGMLFLREQMLSKAAECTANALKGFTQMQV